MLYEENSNGDNSSGQGGQPLGPPFVSKRSDTAARNTRRGSKTRLRAPDALVHGQS